LPQTFERVDDSLLGSFSLVYLFGYVNSRDTVALSQPPVGAIVAIRKIKSGPTHFGGGRQQMADPIALPTAMFGLLRGA
jgi:hypothetical protein